MIARSPPGNPTLPSKTIEEPARQVPLYGEYEVAVLGGGPAGIAAAVAAKEHRRLSHRLLFPRAQCRR